MITYTNVRAPAGHGAAKVWKRSVHETVAGRRTIWERVDAPFRVVLVEIKYGDPAGSASDRVPYYLPTFLAERMIAPGIWRALHGPFRPAKRRRLTPACERAFIAVEKAIKKFQEGGD